MAAPPPISYTCFVPGCQKQHELKQDKRGKFYIFCGSIRSPIFFGGDLGRTLVDAVSPPTPLTGTFDPSPRKSPFAQRPEPEKTDANEASVPVPKPKVEEEYTIKFVEG